MWLATPPLSEAGDDKDLQRAVREALAELTSVDAEIVVMREFGAAFSYKEIGEALHIAEGTARVRHHRAMKRLGEVLKRDRRIISWLEQRGII